MPGSVFHLPHSCTSQGWTCLAAPSPHGHHPMPFLQQAGTLKTGKIPVYPPKRSSLQLFQPQILQTSPPSILPLISITSLRPQTSPALAGCPQGSFSLELNLRQCPAPHPLCFLSPRTRPQQGIIGNQCRNCTFSRLPDPQPHLFWLDPQFCALIPLIVTSSATSSSQSQPEADLG